MDWPARAIHMMLLPPDSSHPEGKILAWHGHDAPVPIWVWDVATETTVSTPVDDGSLFCTGHTHLADGRAIVAGGSPSTGGGPFQKHTYVFDPATETWTRVRDMNFERWYPTLTGLPDGRVLAMAGASTLRPPTWVPIPEVYDPVNDTWTPLDGASLPLPNYAHMFVLGDGKLLYAGPSATTHLLDTGAQTWQVVATSTWGEEDVGPQGGSGSAAMYRQGKVLKVGGQEPAVACVEVLDTTTGNPPWTWTPVASMAYPRRRLNLVLLPDGKVLAVGGSASGDRDPDCAIHAAEIWNPKEQTWTTVASMARPRMYHSAALLLPDGRVLAGAGDHTMGNEPNYEIYSPPYLFRGNQHVDTISGARPVITTAPSSATYGETFQVETPDSSSIRSVVFMRPGSTTHTVNQSQSYTELSFLDQGTHLDVSAPAGANLATPGDYMLFLLNRRGVPSVARFVRLRHEVTTMPMLSIPGLAALAAALVYLVIWTAQRRLRTS